MAAPVIDPPDAKDGKATWRCPDARQILRANVPDRELWLAERRKGIGGSDTPALLGESRFQSLYGLWLDKTGQAEDVETTDAMRHGTWAEGHLADWFAKETGLRVIRCGLLASKERDHLRTNPDRLVADGGNLEIKTTMYFTDAAKEWRGGIARDAYIQGQQQLAVTGRSHVWFVAYVDREPMLRGPVPRDEALIAEIIKRVDEFWFNNVLPGVPPEVDLANITDQEIALRWPKEIVGKLIEAEFPAHLQALLDERFEIKAGALKYEKRAKEIDQAIRVMAGDAEGLLIDGRPVVTFKTQLSNPSVDKALQRDYPGLWKQYINQGSSRRINVKKQKP